MTAAVYGASMVVLHGDAVLLVKRGREPLAGLWSLPGGRIEDGESSLEAALREAFEETGLRPVNARFLAKHRICLAGQASASDARDRTEKTGETWLDVYYACAESRLVEAGDDASEARFVSLDKLDAYPLTEGACDLILAAASLLADKPCT